MNYVALYKIAIVASDSEAGSQAAIALTNNPADALTFTIPLSESGEFPPTHWGCCTAASEAMREGMLALNSQLGSQFATAEIDGIIIASSYPALIGLDDPWGRLLDALNLKVCQEAL